MAGAQHTPSGKAVKAKRQRAKQRGAAVELTVRQRHTIFQRARRDSSHGLQASASCAAVDARSHRLASISMRPAQISSVYIQYMVYKSKA